MQLRNEIAPRLAWIAILVSASLALSSILACAMPFAALAAVAAITLKRVDAFAVVIAAWFVNQLVGFALLGYPVDATTLAWGVALGLSAVVALMAAIEAVRLVRDWPTSVAVTVVFAIALVAQQLTIFSASLVLESHPSAFAPDVLAWIAITNAICVLALLAIHELGERLRMPGAKA